MVQSPSTKVIIKPGIYHNAFMNLNVGGTRYEPVEIVAEQSGTVIVDGSETFTGNWSSAGIGTYVADWKYNWEAFNSWELAAGNDLLRFREMIIFNGKILKQVLNMSALVNDSFYIDRNAKKVYVRVNTNPSMADIRIPIYENLLNIGSNVDYFVMRGITFRYCNSYGSGAAVFLDLPSHILIEDCNFTDNNGYGLRSNWARDYDSSHDYVFRNSRFNNNGGCGFGLNFKIRDALVEDCEVKNNLWRMELGQYNSPDLAAIGKTMFSKNVTYRRIDLINNSYRGIWIDYGNVNTNVDNCYFSGNHTGMWTEINPEGITIRDCYFYNTPYEALTVASSEGTIIDNCKFYQDNTLTGVFSTWEPAAERDAGPLKVPYRTQNTILTNNIFAISNSTKTLVYWPTWLLNYNTLKAANNQYYAGGVSENSVKPFKNGQSTLYFNQWKQLTNDSNAKWLTQNPFDVANVLVGFTNPAISLDSTTKPIYVEVSLSNSVKREVSVSYEFINGADFDGTLTDMKGKLIFTPLKDKRKIIFNLPKNYKGQLEIKLSAPSGATLSNDTCIITVK
jgi:hypothetical protein